MAFHRAVVNFPKRFNASLHKNFAMTLRVDHHRRQNFVAANPVEDLRRKTSVAVNSTEDHHRKTFVEANQGENRHRQSSLEANLTKDHHHRYRYNLFLPVFLPMIPEDHLSKSSVASILTEDYLCKIFVAANPPEDHPNPKEALSMAPLLVPKELATSHRHQKVWFGIPLGREVEVVCPLLAEVGCLPLSTCVAFSPTRLN
jgi:hypothetical protein